MKIKITIITIIYLLLIANNLFSQEFKGIHIGFKFDSIPANTPLPFEMGDMRFLLKLEKLKDGRVSKIVGVSRDILCRNDALLLTKWFIVKYDLKNEFETKKTETRYSHALFGYFETRNPWVILMFENYSEAPLNGSSYVNFKFIISNKTMDKLIKEQGVLK